MKVLVVDDSEDSLAIPKARLAGEGVQIITVPEGLCETKPTSPPTSPYPYPCPSSLSTAPQGHYETKPTTRPFSRPSCASRKRSVDLSTCIAYG